MFTSMESTVLFNNCTQHGSTLLPKSGDKRGGRRFPQSTRPVDTGHKGLMPGVSISRSAIDHFFYSVTVTLRAGTLQCSNVTTHYSRRLTEGELKSWFLVDINGCPPLRYFVEWDN